MLFRKSYNYTPPKPKGTLRRAFWFGLRVALRRLAYARGSDGSVPFYQHKTNPQNVVLQRFADFLIPPPGRPGRTSVFDNYGMQAAYPACRFHQKLCEGTHIFSQGEKRQEGFRPPAGSDSAFPVGVYQRLSRFPYLRAFYTAKQLYQDSSTQIFCTLP